MITMKAGMGRIRIAALVTALLSIAGQARANEILGGDIAIHHYEKGKFAIRVNVYQACGTTNFNLSKINVRAVCGGYNKTGGTASGSSKDITPVCRKQCTKCNAPSCTLGFGVNKTWVEDTVLLDNANCVLFTVSYSQSARLSTITTGAASEQFYIEASFNRLTFKENSSITFNTPPLSIVNYGQCVTSVQQVAAPGFDSVSYELAHPLSSSGNSIPYTWWYDYYAPLEYDGWPDKEGEFDPPGKCKGFHVNTQTGQINFKPTEEEITVMVIEATGWNKDTTGAYQKAATLPRDMALSIVQSPENRVPIVTGFNCLRPTVLRICAGRPFSAVICSFDPDVDDTVSLSWNQGIPGASFVVEAGKKKWPKATFSWNPDTSMISEKPYSFIVTGSDNACPLPGVTIKRYEVYVDKEKESSLQKISYCDSVYFIAEADSAYAPGAQYQWFVNETPAGTKHDLMYKFGSSGKYAVKLVVSQGCDQVYYDTVEYQKQPKLVAGSDRSICPGDSVMLSYKPAPGKTYAWTSEPKSVTSSDTLLLVKPAQKTVYTLTETSATCSRSASLTVTLNLPDAFDEDSMTVCAGDAVYLGGQPVPGNQYEWWSNPPGFISTAANPFAYPGGKTTYYRKETSTAGCSLTDSVQVDLRAYPKSAKVSAPGQICAGENFPLRFTPLSDHSYEWRSDPAGFVSNDSFQLVSPPGDMTYILKQTDIKTGCHRYDSVKVTVLPLPDPIIFGTATPCIVGTGSYSIAFTPGHSYTWSASGGTILSGQDYPIVHVKWDAAGIGWIEVTETNKEGCKKTTRLDVMVMPEPKALFSPANKCVNESVLFEDLGHGGNSWEWDFGDGKSSQGKQTGHAYAKAGTYGVRLIAKSIYGCADTAVQQVTIFPAPELKWVIEKESGSTFHFDVTDASYDKYEWDFGDGISSASPAAAHYYTGNGAYSVRLRVATKQGCVTQFDTSLYANFSSLSDTVIIFPNPGEDHVTIRFILSKEAHLKVGIYDELGRALIHDIIDSRQPAGQHDFVLDSRFGQLASAMYFFRISIDEETIFRKVVKIKPEAGL